MSSSVALPRRGGVDGSSSATSARGSNAGGSGATSAIESTHSASGRTPSWHQVIAVSLWVASIYVSLMLQLLTAWRLTTRGFSDTLGLALFVVLLLLTLLPLEWTSGKWSEAFIAWSAKCAADYFSCKVLLEDEESIKASKAYLIAYEPHSSLPVALPMVFAPQATVLPKALRGRTHGLASTVCFWAPVVRQLWWWLGVRPIGKSRIVAMLGEGKAVCLVPGGVQECLHMQPGRETVFLTQRFGFIKLAMQTGVPIVPLFAFGQTGAYSWYRLGPPFASKGFVDAISRYAGAVPMYIYGRFGTSMPRRVPITIVIGRPIDMPHLPDPPPELVQQYLTRYITELTAMFERHKADCGSGHLKLHVI